MSKGGELRSLHRELKKNYDDSAVHEFLVKCNFRFQSVEIYKCE